MERIADILDRQEFFVWLLNVAVVPFLRIDVYTTVDCSLSSDISKLGVRNYIRDSGSLMTKIGIYYF